MSYNSGDSDIESIVTPIEQEEFAAHGQVVESDSFSDFPLHDVMNKGAARRHRSITHEQPEHFSDHYTDDEHNGKDVRKIYRELQIISDKLKDETRLVHEREQKVKERERMVSISHSNIQMITQHEIKQKVSAVEQKYNAELSKLEQALKERNKENKRLKENFETLKQANDMLKIELETLQKQHEKLEKQSTTVQARLTNLQRKQEFDQRTKDADASSSQEKLQKQKDVESGATKKEKNPKSLRLSTGSFDVLAILLDWVSDAHLRYTVTDQPTKPLERLASPDYLQEKILKILPSLVEILKDFPSGNLKLCLPCLQFMYWALINMEGSQGQQKSSLASTFRRLGEEMYRCKSVRFTETESASSSAYKTELKNKENVYFKSSNLHVRLLSSLIILKTLTQADYLAHVFDVLRNDLKSDIAKELFLYYQATPVILHYLKPVNKAFLGSAIDTFLQMSTESPFLQSFLDSCSNESWFRTIAMLLRSPSIDNKLMEKLSIILQKLSKMKTNKKLFEVYMIVSIVQEMLCNCGNENNFLALNLKSVLFNMNVTVRAPPLGQ